MVTHAIPQSRSQRVLSLWAYAGILICAVRSKYKALTVSDQFSTLNFVLNGMKINSAVSNYRINLKANKKWYLFRINYEETPNLLVVLCQHCGLFHRIIDLFGTEKLLDV
ncbi:hypothetical protein ECG_07412 [Echinococcus granulosus]|uniref:LAGLIDADG endonuclease n=1 Tax=Echinococcus granulosus TaxID=6210 RepID=A0A068WUD0_ECHGR|nr:hypothetical protein ECG_07412 [Echinococcus granulosus]CDS22108.1 hypothetical protein EgrG_000057800 [Echinococcus granulosus]